MSNNQLYLDRQRRRFVCRGDRATLSEAIAAGSLAFVDKVEERALGGKAMHREVAEVSGTYTLWEPSEAYMGDFAGKSEVLMPYNTPREKR